MTIQAKLSRVRRHQELQALPFPGAALPEARIGGIST